MVLTIRDARFDGQRLPCVHPLRRRHRRFGVRLPSLQSPSSMSLANHVLIILIGRVLRERHAAKRAGPHAK